MADAPSLELGPTPEDLSIVASLPRGLLQEAASCANRRGLSLAEFISWAIDPDEGFDVTV